MANSGSAREEEATLGEHEAQHPGTVAVVRCEGYDAKGVREAVGRGLDLLGGVQRFAQPGETILLKPNVLAGRAPERAVTTHPAVFRAVAEHFKEAGVGLTYGDSPGFGRPEALARRAGLAAVAEDLGVPFADFRHGESVPFHAGRLIKRFVIARGVLNADGMVSLPKLKTHGLTRITGALKNLFGCIPGPLKSEFHARLPNADQFSRMLVDLNRFLRPRLHVMDGIVAMEGNGPQGGDPRSMSVLLLSTDPVAMDATACRLIDLDPRLVPTLTYGAEWGLGLLEGITWLGDPIDELTRSDFVVNRSAAATTGRPGRPSRLARRLVVPRPTIREARCTRCGTCVEVCPVEPKAVAFENGRRDRTPVHRYRDCIRCYCCQELCPERAIEIEVPLLGRLIHR